MPQSTSHLVDIWRRTRRAFPPLWTPPRIPQSPSHIVDISRWTRSRVEQQSDQVVIEEPLEIRVRAAADAAFETLSVTMRTPGHDGELALGFLHGEGLRPRRQEVLEA